MGVALTHEQQETSVRGSEQHSDKSEQLPAVPQKVNGGDFARAAWRAANSPWQPWQRICFMPMMPERLQVRIIQHPVIDEDTIAIPNNNKMTSYTMDAMLK